MRRATISTLMKNQFNYFQDKLITVKQGEGKDPIRMLLETETESFLMGLQIPNDPTQSCEITLDKRRAASVSCGANDLEWLIENLMAKRGKYNDHDHARIDGCLRRLLAAQRRTRATASKKKRAFTVNSANSKSLKDDASLVQ